MSAKKIGIIGHTGRTGQILVNMLKSHPYFKNGLNFSRKQAPALSINDVFEDNDYIIDFSSGAAINKILETALSIPKPLVICATGWSYEEVSNLINLLSNKTPLIIASNTSIGASLQQYIAEKLASMLGTEFDIDIHEQHHRNKIDIPSGTANSLAETIIDTKKKSHNLTYKVNKIDHGPRPDDTVGITSIRSGNIIGEHSIKFTSEEEMITITHTALNRELFARGALRMVEWIRKANPKPGLYSIKDTMRAQ